MTEKHVVLGADGEVEKVKENTWDAEIAVMRECYESLHKLDPQSQRRVLRWLWERMKPNH